MVVAIDGSRVGWKVWNEHAGQPITESRLLSKSASRNTAFQWCNVIR